MRAETHHLGGDREVAARRELMDHLHRRARAGPVAEPVDVAAHDPEQGLRRLPGGVAARRHHRQRSRLGAHGPAGDGGVEVEPAFALRPRADPLSGVGRDRHARQHQRAGGQRSRGAPGAEQDGIELRRVDDHRHERLRPRAGVGDRGRARAAPALDPVERGRVEVEPRDGMPGRQQVAGHPPPHRAESRKSDLHVRSLRQSISLISRRFIAGSYT